MNKKKGILRNAAEGYFAAFALANIGQIAAVNIISLVLFLMCFQLFLFADRKETESALSADGKKLVKGYSSRNRRVASVVLGILFAFFLFGCGAWFSYRGFGEQIVSSDLSAYDGGRVVFPVLQGVPPSLAVSGKAFPCVFLRFLWCRIRRSLHFLCRLSCFCFFC